MSVLLVMFSATIHEVAHGWVALKCGDTTAKEAGRLLDPRAHLDGFGSVVLPLFMALMGGPMFALPSRCPTTPIRLKNPRRDEVLVAIAGPVLQPPSSTSWHGLVRHRVEISNRRARACGVNWLYVGWCASLQLTFT